MCFDKFFKNPFLKTKFAFSIIEILVALIVVSVILAALAPIITKRTQSSSITVTSTNVSTSDSSISEITTECQNNTNFSAACKLCTPNFCIDCGLEKCPVGQFVDNKTCSCKFCSEKYGLTCSECNSNGCLKCNSSSYYISAGNCIACPTGSYCDGANSFATCPEGSYCDSSGIHKCNQKFANCSKCSSSACTECSSYYFVSAGVCKSCGLSSCTKCASTTKCTLCESFVILNTSTGKCDTACSTVLSGCLRCTSKSACNQCTGTHYLNSSKTCTKCSVANCLKCIDGQSSSSPKCGTCLAGYYLNSSSTCASCSSKFGSNCVSCDSTQCLACASGYYITDSTASTACESDGGIFKCSDSNFMQVGNLCMTRKNMGDASILPIPDTVTVVTAGSDKCHSESSKCCWKGTTSTSCDSTYGGYSGCTRTVCNFEAAQEICKKFNYGGKTWRLPTANELTNLGQKYSIGLGAKGLMLCDSHQGNKSTWCAGSSKCPGAKLGNCYPENIYSDTLDANQDGYLSGYTLDDIYSINTSYASSAVSVRCVSSE